MWKRKTAPAKLQNRTQIYIRIYAFPHVGDWINRQISFGIKHGENYGLSVAYLNLPLSLTFSLFRKNSHKKICYHNGYFLLNRKALCHSETLFRSGFYCSWKCWLLTITCSMHREAQTLESSVNFPYAHTLWQQNISTVIKCIGCDETTETQTVVCNKKKCNVQRECGKNLSMFFVHSRQNDEKSQVLSQLFCLSPF